MTKTAKNAMLFVTIGVLSVLIYVFVIKKDEPEANLTSSTGNPLNTTIPINTVEETVIDSETSQNILATLSNLKNITLDDSIFASNSFLSLKDGTVPLLQDGPEGRPNPFAPFGVDDGSFVPENIINQNEEIPIPAIESPKTETNTTPATKTPTNTINKKNN